MSSPPDPFPATTQRRHDLLAGTSTHPVIRPAARPTVVVLDSGVGGLTVLHELRRARPDAEYVYAADDAAFPYGSWAEGPLVRRVEEVVAELILRHSPDIVVVACNTISTLVLPVLRARFGLPFVGTVPAVKPAAAISKTGRIAILATPGTVRRDYTRDLVAAYAGGCVVDLVGSTRLAAMAEAELVGRPVPDEVLAAEIAPCFAEREGRRTDTIVLACTHYPLLLSRMEALAPWPVAFVDPAPAVARRVVQILGGAPVRPGPAPRGLAIFTGEGRDAVRLRHALAAFGLPDVETGLCPLALHAREHSARAIVDAAAAAA